MTIYPFLIWISGFNSLTSSLTLFNLDLIIGPISDISWIILFFLFNIYIKFSNSFFNRNLLLFLSMFWILTKIQNFHFNFNNTFKFIYGGHLLNYISYLLLSSFICSFPSHVFVTHRNLTTFSSTFMQGFTQMVTMHERISIYFKKQECLFLVLIW